MTMWNPYCWAPYWHNSKAPIAGRASTQPSLFSLPVYIQACKTVGQPTQEDWLVRKDLVRVSITSGVLGHFEAAVEEALLDGSRSREPD